MDREKTEQELWQAFRDGDIDESTLRSFSSLLENDPDLAATVQGELQFDEWIRCALSDQESSEGSRWGEMEESFALEFSELVERAKDGSLTKREGDRLAAKLLERDEQVRGLRNNLAQDEWVRQALSEAKGEEAFLEALETRMWAETKSDHFVEDFTKRLDQEIAEHEDNIIPMPVSWGWQATKMAGVAAAVAIGAFFLMQTVAENLLSNPSVATVVKVSTDAVWGNADQPGPDGSVTAGVYQLSGGVVSLKFDSGSELTIEGPAQFEVKDDEETFVYHGVAIAKAASKDQPLRLRSKGITVSESVPLIGIDARSDSFTEAIVFSGDGGVCLDKGDCRSLFEKEAIKADLNREKLLDIPYNPKPFSKAWAMASGVFNNLGSVRIELPGTEIEAREGEEKMQVFVENESFHPEVDLEVDQIEVGQFASAEENPGESLHVEGELRSYLVQVWPQGSGDDGEVEASLTFDHPVVGVIFSSDRLASSDSSVGTLLKENGEDFNRVRGLDSGSDELLLSDDRKTLNLKLQNGKQQVDQVRVLVALN